MNERSLQDDLLRIPGVEGAEVEGSADKPAGLRIRIAEGADQGAVGGAIRRVLTSHGLGTDTRLPGEPNHGGAEPGSTAPREEVPDMVPIARRVGSNDDRAGSGSGVAVAPADESRDAAVIDLTDRASTASEEEPAESPTSDSSVADRRQADEFVDADEDDPSRTASIDDDAVAPAPPEQSLDETLVGASERNPVMGERPDHDRRSDDGGSMGALGARLASVAVQEGRTGIVVTVSASDGSQIQQAAASTEGGVESAVVRATTRLALPGAPDATVIEIEDRRIEGVDIVLIVLDVDGVMHAGAAVVGAGRSFALGRATWAALTL
ncbi:MAG TPA: hypothetical protein VLA29_02095 [Acidimicrobiia bacterium]|nr:hypothetical protein [Acidimicrobiia bacterium]